jgi:hypothetical protein
MWGFDGTYFIYELKKRVLQKRKCYLLFNSATALPPGTAAYRTRMICLNVAFQTPSSNSCIKSTTSMGYGLNPKRPSLSAKAFFRPPLSDAKHDLLHHLPLLAPMTWDGACVPLLQHSQDTPCGRCNHEPYSQGQKDTNVLE